MDSQKFCLKWDSFQSNVTSVFDHLRQDEELVDVTLCCEGQKVKAHRMMLSASSPYFRDILRDNPCQHIVIVLKDTSAADLCAIVEFMYKGSVNIAQNQLATFIKTAEMLQIKGLSGDDDRPPLGAAPSPRRVPASPRSAQSGTPPTKRRRTSGPDPAAGDYPLSQAAEPPPPPPPPPPAPAPAPEPAAPAGMVHRPPASPLSAGNKSVPSPGQASQTGRPSQPSVAQGGYVPAPPAAAATASPHEVKIEKVDVDLTEDDDESLDATLGYVSEFEGGYSEQELSLGSMTDAVAAGDLAGPSQRLVEDGSSQGRTPCDVCGKSFTNDYQMKRHRKRHLGQGKCPQCERVFGRADNLRQHLQDKHRMSREEILRTVPLRRILTPQWNHV